MRFGLNEDIITLINKIFAAFPEVQKVIIYGSRAKGNYRNGSDIDLTLEGDLLSHDLLTQISWKLDDLLLPYTFDLSLCKYIEDVALLAHIQRVGEVFYADNLFVVK